MRLKTTFPILALTLPLAACGSGNGSTSSKQEPAPISRAAFGMIDAQMPLVTPSVPETPAPVAVEKPATPVEAPLPPPTTYAEAMHRAQDLADKGDHPGAIEALKFAVKFASKSAAPQVELARIYLADGKIPAARKHAVKATELNPAWSGAWNMLGRVEMADGKLAEARAAFQTSIESNEDNAYAWNNLGLTFIYAEKWQDAADALEHAVAISDAKPYMWNNLGIAYEHLDRLDEARHAYDQAASAGSDAGKKSRARLEGVKTIVDTTASVSPKGDEVPAGADDAPTATVPPAPAKLDSATPAVGGTR